MDLRDKQILITGANGFIGGRVAERLRDEYGARVRGLVRDPKTWKARSVETFQVFPGDITDADAVHRAVENCDAIIHCAAMQFRGSLADFRRVNVDGTLNLLRAARDANVERFIHLSTINAHGIPPPRDAHSDSPLAFRGDPYSISKAEGERAASEFAQNYHLPITIIRPACTYGPKSFSWSVVPLQRVRRGAPVLIGNGDGICNAVYIDNLTDLIILSLQNDAAIGESFIGAEGRGVTWREFYGAYARMIGIRKLNRMPRAFALAITTAFELISKITGKSPRIAKSSIEFYSHRVVFDISKATRLLGYQPRISFEEGMARTQHWLAEHGYLNPNNQ
jgi:nucleoside-diphosphate-sugar epimerase